MISFSFFIKNEYEYGKNEQIWKKICMYNWQIDDNIFRNFRIKRILVSFDETTNQTNDLNDPKIRDS